MQDGHNGDPGFSAGDPSVQNGGPPQDDRPPSMNGHEYGHSPLGGEGSVPPNGSVIFREKQIKVLRSFHLSILVSLASSALQGTSCSGLPPVQSLSVVS